MKKQVIYLAGVFPIAIILLLLTLYFVKIKDLTGCIKIGLPYRDENPIYHQQYIASRKFITIKLTGNEIADKSKLKFARLKLREIRNSQSLKKGVHFIFSEKSQYWAFIEVLDILETEKTEIWGLYNNDIWSGNDNLPEIKFP